MKEIIMIVTANYAEKLLINKTFENLDQKYECGKIISHFNHGEQKEIDNVIYCIVDKI
jgi:hypothetical protein